MQSRDKLAQAIHLHRLGQVEAAERIYRDILRQDPTQPDALHLLGLARHQRGDHSGAITAISRAIDVHPREAGFYANRGEALRALGRHDEAAADLRQAISLAPELAAAHNNLGLVLRAQKLHSAARASFERALAIKVAFPEAWNNL